MTASAQLDIFERLVMPGPLISGHAEYEDDCDLCHARFSRQSQRTLCLDCHTEIATDLQALEGFHGLSPEAGDEDCVACHTDHEGRDADVLGLVEDAFNHDLTRFPLRDSHLEPVCSDCHLEGSTFHAAETECVSCHLEDDQHMGNLGEACSDCHSETDWADAVYDHELGSGYALTGAHSPLACASCHIEETYVDTPTTCVGCHFDDDTHTGTNGTECQDCHTTINWEETTFDHFAAAEFALVDGHAGLACESCHQGNKFEVATPTQCVGCHLADDVHEGINGEECQDCHRESDWLDVRFDHAIDADFPLNAAHADLDCASCHLEAVAVSLPATTCIGCHESDDPHEMQLGDECDRCHAERTWTEDILFDHDLTAFPLLGVHGRTECEDCHQSHAFLDAPEECVDCHLEDDVHAARFGEECAFCHVPVDWLSWRFDHDAETDFPLDGAHDGLDCHGCHREAVNVLAEIDLSTSCASCHRADDVHRGEFGNQCDECHRTTSFADLKSLQ
ncbi:MAG: cytochrome c3 family protein [Gammaproteobacteria bacterium]